MKTGGTVSFVAGSMEIPKELESAIHDKVTQLVENILEDAKLGERRRGRSRSSGSRSRSRSRSGRRSRSRSHGKIEDRQFGPDSRKRSGRRGRKPCIGWEGFAPFRSHHHFHHHHPPHHGWFGGEFGPGARRGRWGKHGRFPFERNFECECGSGTEEKKDEGEYKENTPAPERSLRSDFEYLELEDGTAEAD